MSTNKKTELYRPVGEEIVVEAHARVGVRPVAEAAPQRGGGEAAGVGVGAREREEQRRRRCGPIGGSGGGRGRGGQEEDGGEGPERAGPRPASTRHGAASSRGEWGGWGEGGWGRSSRRGGRGEAGSRRRLVRRGGKEGCRPRGSPVNSRRHRWGRPVRGTSDIF
jgi:hypothetical protein